MSNLPVLRRKELQAGYERTAPNIQEKMKNKDKKQKRSSWHPHSESW